MSHFRTSDLTQYAQRLAAGDTCANPLHQTLCNSPLPCMALPGLMRFGSPAWVLLHVLLHKQRRLQACLFACSTLRLLRAAR